MSDNIVSMATTAFCALAFLLLFLFIMIASSIRIVPEHKRLSVYRLGRYIGERGPGLVFLVPGFDRAVAMDQQVGAGNNQASLFMVGAIGEARTMIEDRGEVVINGITWNATSKQSIMPGTRIQVKRVIVEVDSV